jgi:hypothetical protein
MAIPKNLSIVKLETRHHRVVARENWNLTKEQMKGMHVHHRIPVSEGGTNDPSNLYVCSPSMHRWGWHNGEKFIEWANEGSKNQPREAKAKGGKKTADLGVGIHAPGMQSKNGRIGGKKTAELGVGIHGRSAEERAEDGREGGRKGGAKAVELGVGVHGRSAEQWTEDSRRGGERGGERAAELGVGIHGRSAEQRAEDGRKAGKIGGKKGSKTTNSQKWVCLETGHISTPAGLSNWQKARGIDTSMRVKLVG